MSRKRSRKRTRLVAETSYYRAWADGAIMLTSGFRLKVLPHELDALVAVAQYLEDLTDTETKALWVVQGTMDGDWKSLPDSGTVEVMRQGMMRLAAQHGPVFMKAWRTAMVDGLGSFNVMAVTIPGGLLDDLRQERA